MVMTRQNLVIDPCPDLDRNPPVGELDLEHLKPELLAHRIYSHIW